MPAIDKLQAKEQVLALAFEGRWTQEEMAERVRISVRTIRRWLTSQEFKDRIAAQRANLAESLTAVPYADKLARIIGLSQMAESARREYEARPWLKEVRPTPDGELVNEHFNRDAHAAYRDALSDIAAELGARKNVTEHQGTINLNEQVLFVVPERDE